MLFMVIEHFREGRAPDIYRRFRDRQRLAPEGLRYVSSWVDLGFRRCFQVMEAPDEALLYEWIAAWQDLAEFEVVPVRTSAEAAGGDGAGALNARASTARGVGSSEGGEVEP